MESNLKSKWFSKIYFVGLLLLLVCCSKDKVSKSGTYQQLTKSPWTFFIVKPGDPLPNPSYSIYHIPPNIGFYTISSHYMTFNINNNINFFPERTGLTYSWELQHNLTDMKVDKYVLGGNSYHEIWAIKEISDTLLDIRVRDISEPETTEYYWGYKYRRF